jgi:hypothetical protein
VREAIKAGMRDSRRAEAIREIGTLHESRFVLFDDDARLMFCSSFDGTWDQYIDDFVSTYIRTLFRTLFGAIFEHCDGFPGMGDAGGLALTGSLMAEKRLILKYTNWPTTSSVEKFWETRVPLMAPVLEAHRARPGSGASVGWCSSGARARVAGAHRPGPTLAVSAADMTA